MLGLIFTLSILGFLICILLFLVGLIKPGLVLIKIKKNRKNVIKIYGIGMFLCLVFIIISIISISKSIDTTLSYQEEKILDEVIEDVFIENSNKNSRKEISQEVVSNKMNLISYKQLIENIDQEKIYAEEGIKKFREIVNTYDNSDSLAQKHDLLVKNAINAKRRFSEVGHRLENRVLTDKFMSKVLRSRVREQLNKLSDVFYNKAELMDYVIDSLYRKDYDFVSDFNKIMKVTDTNILKIDNNFSEIYKSIKK